MNEWILGRGQTLQKIKCESEMAIELQSKFLQII